MKRLGMVSIGLFLLGCSGCALTDSTVKLKCDGLNSIAKQENLGNISIKKFEDKRRVDSDPKFIYFKNNNFGKTQGRITSEDTSLEDFTTKVIKSGLENAGFNVPFGDG